MPFLSVSLRIIAIIAAAAAVVIYVQGGNQLKKLKSELEREKALVVRKTTELDEKGADFVEIKEELDETTIELATLKRDERLRKNEALLARQEAEKSRALLKQAENQKLELAELNEDLRRENIDLKAKSFDSSQDPKRLQQKIETQLAEIESLERELRDTQTVVAALFDQDAQTKPRSAPKTARIQKVIPEHQILVLEAGSNDGIVPNAEFDIVRSGNVIAKVKAARVTSELCVVNIVANKGGSNALRQGTQIQYVL